jgi:hypothetical protein
VRLEQLEKREGLVRRFYGATQTLIQGALAAVANTHYFKAEQSAAFPNIHLLPETMSKAALGLHSRRHSRRDDRRDDRRPDRRDLSDAHHSTTA